MLGPHSIRSEPVKAKISVVSTAAEDYKGEMLLVPLYEPEGDNKEALSPVDGTALLLDAKLDGAIADLVTSGEFKGKAGSSANVRLGKGAAVKKIGIYGAGKKDKFDGAAAMKLGDAVAALAKAEKVKTLGVVLPEKADAHMVKKMAEAVMLGLYQDTRFKSKEEDKKPTPLEKIELVGCQIDGAADAISKAEIAYHGVSICRDLVAAPANYITPTKLSEVAKEIAAEVGLECEILERDDCTKLGMGSYLAVSQGAAEPPKFIHLTYKPKGPVTRKVGVVGKGLTFDSGGYNLKAGPGSMIEMMKFDMGGSAATLGAARSVGMLKPEGVEAHFIVASCENMVSAEAMRPGDILTASNGKTIEVLNTDAEGRLTLADALVFAEKQGCTEIVDIATLTGACMISLGDQYAGMWANNKTIAEDVKASAERAGEKLWEMPLCEAEYAEQIKSKIADLKNIGGRYGGSITAALFLKEFVNKSQWVHLDIAGPVWSEKTGATGYGVRTLTEWVLGKK